MAHNYDESMALADVYADALLRAAAAQGRDETVAEEFLDPSAAKQLAAHIGTK